MINGEVLRNAIISGAHNISVQKNHINDLNIFPVPDGDTGTNMSMTVMAAAKALEEYDGETAGEVAAIAAKAMLRGARGNSGVITSILFRGFAQGLKDTDEVNGKNIAAALGIGVDAAYKAVAKPTEGTILTVARMAYEAGMEASRENPDPVYVWQAIVNKANDALAITPELLPVLKKAGVVDAGGKGLCSIFEGMLCCFKDGEIVEYEENQALTMESFDSAAAEFDDDIEFTYCTEFIVGRDPEIETDPEELRDFLKTIGDCVVVVSDEEIDYMKVDSADVFIALNQVGFNKYIDEVSEEGLVVINSTLVESDNPDHYPIPATEIAENMGKPFVVNIVMLGALTRLLPKVHAPAIEEEIKKNFAASIAGSNLEAFETGYKAMADLLASRNEVQPAMRLVKKTA